MKKVKTGDGSYTFMNPEFEEVYHSVSGAEEEAVRKYAEPTKVAEIAKQNGEVRILDVCFGIGYNSAAAIDAVLKANPDCKIKIVGLEKDDTLPEKLSDLEPGFSNYHIIKKIEDGNYRSDNVDITILYGDAAEKIEEVKGEFDVCFLDPFSPRKLPHLWTEGFFKDIASKLKKNALLATFSCATHVRINLVRAGFEVEDGPCVGRRAPSTVATKIV